MAATTFLPRRIVAETRDAAFRPRAAAAHARIAPDRGTAIWAYNGALSGPEIRVRLRVLAENCLGEETTVH